MAVREIRLLGDPRLYEVSEPVRREDLAALEASVRDLHDTLMDFKRRHGAGRAIAAPQIGLLKRLFYVYIDRPMVFLNPVLDGKSAETMELWDDCMCFPDLLVRVKRHGSCRIRYRSMDFAEREMRLEGDLSELIQHEYDHLDGILAVSRALDGRSFTLRSQRKAID